MGASAERRPKTQASDELKRGDLVWDDDLGWGVVLDDVGSGCTSGAPLSVALATSTTSRPLIASGSTMT